MSTTKRAGPAAVRQVADGVYRLGDRYDSWYVIVQGGRLTVVDSGLPKHWPQLPALLKSIGRRLDDIDAVLLTHDHLDHLGNAERLRRDANATVSIHSSEADSARQGGGHPPMRLRWLPAMVRPTVARYVLHSIREGVMRIAPIAKIATFEDGDVLDVPGRPRVIHTPGHSRGECVLHLEQRDVLFSGDALVTLDIAPAHVGPSLLTPPFVLDLAQARASLERIEATGAGVMLPGHGEPWRSGVAEAVRLARSL